VTGIMVVRNALSSMAAWSVGFVFRMEPII
jgi:hypothetical protein